MVSAQRLLIHWRAYSGSLPILFIPSRIQYQHSKKLLGLSSHRGNAICSCFHHVFGFTSPSLRRCPNRYALSCRLELHRYEFRPAPGTVIVTAATGHNSYAKLVKYITLPSTRQASAPILHPLVFAETCVFGNSRLGLFTSTLLVAFSHQRPGVIMRTTPAVGSQLP